MNKEELIQVFKTYNINLDDDLINKLELYYNFLIKTNEEFNLTRITAYDEFFIKHVLDSLIPFTKYDLVNKSLFDLGSGAGFPGMVLAIFNPETKVVLCEAIRKKADFLKSTKYLLNLTNVEVFNERAEKYPNKVDYVTARAVSSISNILDYIKNIVNEETKVVLYKGINYEEEIKAYKANKFLLANKYQVILPNNKGTRTIIIYSKNPNNINNYVKKINHKK